MQLYVRWCGEVKAAGLLEKRVVHPHPFLWCSVGIQAVTQGGSGSEREYRTLSSRFQSSVPEKYERKIPLFQPHTKGRKSRTWVGESRRWGLRS